MHESARESVVDPADDKSMEQLSAGKKRTIINHKKLQLHLEEIENISDYDIDSIKNTSARAITFNQFE